MSDQQLYRERIVAGLTAVVLVAAVVWAIVAFSGGPATISVGPGKQSAACTASYEGVWPGVPLTGPCGLSVGPANPAGWHTAGYQRVCAVPPGTSTCVVVRYDAHTGAIWPYPSTPVAALAPGFAIKPLPNGGR